jgi:hypothetical protein
MYSCCPCGLCGPSAVPADAQHTQHASIKDPQLFWQCRGKEEEEEGTFITAKVWRICELVAAAPALIMQCLHLPASKFNLVNAGHISTLFP